MLHKGQVCEQLRDNRSVADGEGVPDDDDVFLGQSTTRPPLPRSRAMPKQRPIKDAMHYQMHIYPMRIHGQGHTGLARAQ